MRTVRTNPVAHEWTARIPPDQSVRGSVVDVFCGAGGLTHGFLLEGFTICAGIDIDEECRFPFEQNNYATFIRRDVTGLQSSDILPLFLPNQPRILVGCAPCQPFSSYNRKNDDPKWHLLKNFGNLIIETSPDIVSMENVPTLRDFRGGQVFADFVSTLEGAGYWVSWKPAFAPDYGVPQRRSRLVLLASRLGWIELETPRCDPSRYPTVERAIGAMRPLKAGEIDPYDSLHRCSHLSDTNLERIREARPGGSWRDWDQALVADCHRANAGRYYASVYGRMVWHEPAPTITTQFFGFGNGRFGHPEQDRAISLREGALLQSFPLDYEFTLPGLPIRFNKVGRIIGNAVPVLLARAIARSIRVHLEEFSG